jgi:DNA-binding transcriptional MerR regulator
VKLSELARRAGITEQQVRNYLDAGLLPPAERAPNNYRVLTDRHADALPAVRALADGHGWARTRTIMTAVHRGDLATALAAVDESHADLSRERATVAAAIEAFSQAADTPLGPISGGPDPNRPDPNRPDPNRPDPTGHRRIGQVAADTGVHTPVLRLWEKRGLLRPERDPATGYRRYDPAEQRAAHLVAVLRAGGFAFAIIDAALAAVREAGRLDRALAELARRTDQVQHLSRRRLAGSAALQTYLAKHPVG